MENVEGSVDVVNFESFYNSLIQWLENSRNTWQEKFYVNIQYSDEDPSHIHTTSCTSSQGRLGREESSW